MVLLELCPHAGSILMAVCRWPLWASSAVLTIFSALPPIQGFNANLVGIVFGGDYDAFRAKYSPASVVIVRLGLLPFKAFTDSLLRRSSSSPCEPF